MKRSSEFLYKYGNEIEKTKALLCQVFHLSLHGQYFKARDLLLMSHIQESIVNADVATKILYNRAMVQTGLCAFRHGMLKEAHSSLHDIHFSGRVKELLAQVFFFLLFFSFLFFSFLFFSFLFFSFLFFSFSWF